MPVSKQQPQQQQKQPRVSPPHYDWCDVCWESVGTGSSKSTTTTTTKPFLRCRSCGISVHHACYGILGSFAVVHPDTTASTASTATTTTVVTATSFTCWACRAVGTYVTGANRTGTSKQRLLTSQRPTECCLCQRDDGSDWYHAMHPIYNCSGPKGRHLVLDHQHQRTTQQKQQGKLDHSPDDDDGAPGVRLAWAHTLCASGLHVYKGTGPVCQPCQANGEIISYVATNRPESQQDEDDDDDAISVNSDVLEASKDDVSIHHFAYCHPQSDEWNQVQSHQQYVLCKVCNMKDIPGVGYRVPIQCYRHDGGEFYAVAATTKKRYHCHIGMHLGCAMWHRPRPNSNHNNAAAATTATAATIPPNEAHPDCPRVYVSPPVTDASTGLVTKPFQINVFCRDHAEELFHSQVEQSRIVRRPSSCGTVAHLTKKKTVTKPNKKQRVGEPVRTKKNGLAERNGTGNSSMNSEAPGHSSGETNDVSDTRNTHVEEMVQEAASEIVRLENDGRFLHLEDVVASAEARWKRQFHTPSSPVLVPSAVATTNTTTGSSTTFIQFWQRVTAKVYAELDYYSLQPTDWSFLGNDSRATREYVSRWDSVEIIQYR